MRNLFISLVFVFAITACDRDKSDNVRVCGDYEVTMDFPADNPDTLRAVINGDTVDLTIAPSASGARYQGILNDTLVVLWQKGGDWTLILDDDIVIDCAIQ